MPLTVLNVAYPFAPVGLDAVGGAEQILALLDRGLVQRGHRSLVVGCEGSTGEGRVIASAPAATRVDELTQRETWSSHRRAIEEVLRRETVDVVHFHGLDFPEYLPDDLDCGAVATLHLPPTWHGANAFTAADHGVELVCVSESQRRACPPGAQIREVIPNGISLSELTPAKRRGEWLVMLGRICPEKGFHVGLEAARRAGVPLLIAGRVFPYAEHERYFAKEVYPRLSDRRRFLGPIGRRSRRWILSRARALLVPSLAPETSSLVAMEAMACGTPVISYRNGALPDLIEHGRTGFLVDDVEGIVEAIHRLDSIDPAECRAHAERSFSAETMIDRYLAVYEDCARRTRPAPEGGGPRRRLERTGVVIPHRAPPPPSRVERVDTVEELQSLREPWLELWAACPNATPFNHPDWILPWCRHFARRELQSIALFRGERLIGLAPMEIWNEGSVRMLKLLGAGVSDALDVLVAPEDGSALTRELWGAIAACADRWDVCEWSPLRAESPLLGLFLPGADTGACDVSPQLSLAPGRSLSQQVPDRFASNLRYARRRIERELGASFEEAEDGQLDEYLEALVRLHRERWWRRGEGGVFADPGVAAFHREVARRFSRLGMLRLFGIRVCGELIAVLYGFSANGRFHYYLSGFNPSFERFSPGSLVIGQALEKAIAKGERTFDFLRGAEPYKYAWGAEDRPLFRRTMESPVRLAQHEDSLA